MVAGSFEVTLYKDKKLTQTNFVDYISNKTVIISPYVGTNKPDLRYLRYLDSLLDTNNIDEVIILSSDTDKVFHITVDSYFPRLTTISDQQKNFIANLKVSKKHNQTVEHLAHKWKFQQLLVKGKEVGFWEQPLEDQWNKLFESKKTMAKIFNLDGQTISAISTMYRNRDLVDIWDFKDLHVVSSEPGGYALVNEAGLHIYYYNLYQNTILEDLIRHK